MSKSYRVQREYGKIETWQISILRDASIETVMRSLRLGAYCLTDKIVMCDGILAASIDLHEEDCPNGVWQVVEEIEDEVQVEAVNLMRLYRGTNR